MESEFKHFLGVYSRRLPTSHIYASMLGLDARQTNSRRTCHTNFLSCCLLSSIYKKTQPPPNLSHQIIQVRWLLVHSSCKSCIDSPGWRQVGGLLLAQRAELSQHWLPPRPHLNMYVHGPYIPTNWKQYENSSLDDYTKTLQTRSTEYMTTWNLFRFLQIIQLF